MQKDRKQNTKKLYLGNHMESMEALAPSNLDLNIACAEYATIGDSRTFYGLNSLIPKQEIR